MCQIGPCPPTMLGVDGLTRFPELTVSSQSHHPIHLAVPFPLHWAGFFDPSLQDPARPSLRGDRQRCQHQTIPGCVEMLRAVLVFVLAGAMSIVGARLAPIVAASEPPSLQMLDDVNRV